MPQFAKFDYLCRVNLIEHMEKKFNDSNSALSRFGRDKRVRTVTSSAERVERRPHTEHADESPYHRGERGERGERPAKRASYNPHFTEDNRPLFGDREERRPYGNRGDRPSYGNHPKRSYGEPADRRSYDEGAEGRPFNNDRPNRPYGERGANSDYSRKPYAAKPYGNKPHGSKPYGAKPYGSKPYGERPYGKPAYGDEANSEGSAERPYGEPRFGDNRFGDRPHNGRSYGDRKFGAKRSGDKPFGKHQGGKPFGKREDERPRSYPKFAAEPLSGEMRLNRFLAQSGLCSRREADDYITAGLVTVNGEIVTVLGTKVKPTDEVKFNDSRVQGEKKVYLVLNKPKGYVTSLEDPHADKLVMDLVKGACTERIYPVGRLDKNSVGLLLFTNDGDLTKTLTHPSYRKKKIYQVSLDKPLTRADMDRLTEGITLEDGEIFADEISYLKENKQEVGIEIHSGRNRIVRRMFEFLGYAVTKLDRVYYAGLTKKNLKRGAWRFLTREEVDRLKSGLYE